ncbi:MAG: hypothetical protein EBU70_15705, partial [Actinobacteria bacterium]|nr:hypothetical protein [Actinomycetota bacterium]
DGDNRPVDILGLGLVGATGLTWYLGAVAALAVGGQRRTVPEAERLGRDADRAMDVVLAARGDQGGGAARDAVADDVHAAAADDPAGAASDASSGTSNGQVESTGWPSQASRSSR